MVKIRKANDLDIPQLEELFLITRRQTFRWEKPNVEKAPPDWMAHLNKIFTNASLFSLKINHFFFIKLQKSNRPTEIKTSE